MLPRYSRPEMAAVWSDTRRFERWLAIELALVEVLEEDGVAPRGTATRIRDAVTIDPEAIAAIEATTRHDVIAFLTHVEDQVGAPSQYVHLGLTSSDVLDTATAMAIRDAWDILSERLEALAAAARVLADEHRHTVMVGRTHGIHAEPITFGLKAASWYAELERSRDRVAQAVDDLAVGKMSGAVGTYSTTSPEAEARILDKLGLAPEVVATQVIPRDRHATLITSLAVLAGSMERIATEIRHLQRTEVGEASEPFRKGQKGSSAMPHKKNPILTENVTGLARLVRSYAVAALENIALWHERDISHSSVERVALPDSFVLTDFMAHRLHGVLADLVVDPSRMAENLARSRGLVGSQAVLTALVRKGLKRQDAYRVVQRCAMTTWDTGRSFEEVLSDDEELDDLLTGDELHACFDHLGRLAHIDRIIDRATGGTDERREALRR